MILDTFPRPLLEALAAHETLRKLGFTPDQIFMHQNPPPLSDIAVVLRHQGKQFAITVGKYDADGDWQEKWKELVALFNSKTLPEAEFQRFYESSITGANHVSLLLALHKNGIKPPFDAD